MSRLRAALFCLLSLASVSRAQWQLRFSDDAPANNRKNAALLADIQRLLPHYDERHNPRLRFSFHHPAQAQSRWQALQQRLPKLAGRHYNIFNQADADLLHIELVATNATGCPTTLTIQDPALPIAAHGLTIKGDATLALSPAGTLLLRKQQRTPFIAFAYQAESGKFHDLQNHLGHPFNPLTQEKSLLIGLRRLQDSDNASRQADEETLRQHLKNHARRGKAMSLSPVTGAAEEANQPSKQGECFIHLRRL